jgi:tRNA(adenine34) deaminase
LNDHDYMTLALEAASAAVAKGEVPVGAVLAADSGEVLAVASNAQITSCDPTAHAEMLALRLGAEKLNNYRLPGLHPLCHSRALHYVLRRSHSCASEATGFCNTRA